MKTIRWTLTLAAALVGGGLQAQTWTVPAESVRCPSKWGAADERGSANHMKPASVLRAAQFSRSGEVIEIAHPLATRAEASTCTPSARS